MPRRTVSVGKIAFVLLLIVFPFFIHAAIVSTTRPSLVLAASLLQLLLLGLVVAGRHRSRLKELLAGAAALAAVLAWGHREGLSLALMPGIPHALTYSALLLGFGTSLLPGHVPILTRVVVSVRGTLPEDLLLHTRRVTAAWCVFFAAQLVTSLVLYLWAPLEVWSFFINVVNLPLVLLMFVAEYAYRVYRFRGYPHDSFADMIRIVAKTARTGAKQADSA